MSRINRRSFLKSAALAMAGAWVIFRMELAEAREVKRRTDLVEGVAKAGTPMPADAASEADALRFLVVGDWGWAGIKPRPNPASATESEDNARRGRGERAVAVAMGAWAQSRRPAFVLSVGDNFYPNGVKSVNDARWKDAYEDVYTAPALQVPWYVALGNHDYRASVQAQIDYSKLSKRWRMPARYFTFTEKSPAGVSVQFFVLDTCPFAKGLHQGGHSDVAAQDTAAQLAWLERELAASTAGIRILVGHHPLWTGGVRRDMREQSLNTILPPLMKRHGVNVYLCGHEHDAQHIEVDGIHNFVIGHGGDRRPTGVTAGTRFAESREGFAAIAVNAAGVTVHFVDASGEVRHTAVVPKPVRVLTGAAQ